MVSPSLLYSKGDTVSDMVSPLYLLFFFLLKSSLLFHLRIHCPPFSPSFPFLVCCESKVEAQEMG